MLTGCSGWPLHSDAPSHVLYRARSTALDVNTAQPGPSRLRMLTELRVAAEAVVHLDMHRPAVLQEATQAQAEPMVRLSAKEIGTPPRHRAVQADGATSIVTPPALDFLKTGSALLSCPVCSNILSPDAYVMATACTLTRQPPYPWLLRAPALRLGTTAN